MILQIPSIEFFFNFPEEKLPNQSLITQLCVVDCFNSKEYNGHPSPQSPNMCGFFHRAVWIFAEGHWANANHVGLNTAKLLHLDTYLLLWSKYLLALVWFISILKVDTYININSYLYMRNPFMNGSFYKDKEKSVRQKISSTDPNFIMRSNDHLFQ